MDYCKGSIRSIKGVWGFEYQHLGQVRSFVTLKGCRWQGNRMEMKAKVRKTTA